MSGTKALTTKQAKASYKARNNPTITETEKRWIQRAVELEQRAARRQEQEKKRNEAAKKRSERENGERLSRNQAQLGTQRRLDRFGHKSSQLHLGNYFGRTAGPGLKDNATRPAAKDEDIFEDDAISDEALLEALETPVVQPELMQRTSIERTSIDPRTNQSCASHSNVQEQVSIPSSLTEDLSCFWDELDCSTQIAREPDTQPCSREAVNAQTSFCSDASLELTLEDLHELDQLAHLHRAKEKSMPVAESKLQETTAKEFPAQMSPVPLASKQGSLAASHSKSMALHGAQLGHADLWIANEDVPSSPKQCITGKIPLVPTQNPQAIQVPKQMPIPNVPDHSVCNISFTSSELERLVDDDLELTQTTPG